MPEPTKRPPRTREYPPFYEKAVPVALAVVAIAILILIVIALSVVLGLFPSPG